jgi:hypothetical protein
MNIISDRMYIIIFIGDYKNPFLKSRVPLHIRRKVKYIVTANSM